MLEQFDTWARELGALGYLVLGLSALLEHVFPPFPGDSLVLLGGAYAEREHRSLALVLLAVTTGSVAGIGLNYAVGRAMASTLARLEGTQRLLGIKVSTLHHAQASMRQRGTWLLVANRFLPSFRAVLYLAAGASQMRLGRVLLLGTVSTLLWNSLLLAVGATVGANAEALEGLASTYRRGAYAVMAAVALGLVVRWWLKRRPKTVVGA